MIKLLFPHLPIFCRIPQTSLLSVFSLPRCRPSVCLCTDVFPTRPVSVTSLSILHYPFNINFPRKTIRSRLRSVVLPFTSSEKSESLMSRQTVNFIARKKGLISSNSPYIPSPVSGLYSRIGEVAENESGSVRSNEHADEDYPRQRVHAV